MAQEFWPLARRDEGAWNFAIARIPHHDKVPRMTVSDFTALHGMALAQTLAQSQAFVGAAYVSH